jgi:putrescine importer
MSAFGKGAAKEEKIGFLSCLFFGLGVLSPLAPVIMYGQIQSETKGHMALAYLIALVPMAFVAYVFGLFSSEFPRGGSSYSYVSKGLHPNAGFFTGWMIILDYCLIPLMSYMFFSIYLCAIFPALNPKLVMLALIAIVFLINLSGIQGMSKVNNVITLAAFAVIGYFVVRGIAALGAGRAGVGLSSLGFFDPAKFDLGLVLRGSATACFSYLGFDAISTLSEEVKNPRRTISLALILTCLIMAAIFIVVSWVAQCLYPDFTAYTDPSMGILDALRLAGGKALCDVVSIIIVVSMFAITIDMMAASTRMLFAMGRDGALPRKVFGAELKNHVPIWNLVIISVVSASFIWVDVNMIISMVTFGGLLAYIMVNASAIKYFFLDKEGRRGIDILTKLAMPLVALGTSVFLWLNLGWQAKILGFSWAALGIVYMLAKSRFFKVPIASQAEEVDAAFAADEA